MTWIKGLRYNLPQGSWVEEAEAIPVQDHGVETFPKKEEEDIDDSE